MCGSCVLVTKFVSESQLTESALLCGCNDCSLTWCQRKPSSESQLTESALLCGCNDCSLTWCQRKPSSESQLTESALLCVVVMIVA